MIWKTRDDLYDCLVNLWPRFEDRSLVGLHGRLELNTDLIFMTLWGLVTFDFTEMGAVMTVNEEVEILFSKATEKDFDNFVRKIAERKLINRPLASMKK